MIVTAKLRAGAFTCVISGLFALFLAGCSLVDAPQPTATNIVITDAPTASPRPPSPTVTATRTAAPTATNRPSATPSSTATVVPATDTVAPPTATRTATQRATLAATVAATIAATVAATDGPAATNTEPAPEDFTPTAVSIWDIPNPGEDVASGDCSNSFTPSYGLVQITPQGDTLGWKNQEQAPYTVSKVSANVWQYSGPSAVGDGTVTMTVTFTSTTTFELTHSFVPTDSPNCTHTHQMHGTFRNFR